MGRHLDWEEHWNTIFQTSADSKGCGPINIIDWMGAFIFWNALMISKIMAVSLCIAYIVMLILKESAFTIEL